MTALEIPRSSAATAEDVHVPERLIAAPAAGVSVPPRPTWSPPRARSSTPAR